MEYKRAYQKNHRIALNFALSAPFIWLQLIPLVVLDVTMEIYHRTCFPLYGIPTLRRRDYIRLDRQKLSYLTWYEKINCAYCGYANGLLHYVSTIAGQTEKYWCGIMHAKYNGFKPPEHHKDFLPYDDKEAFDKFVKS